MLLQHLIIKGSLQIFLVVAIHWTTLGIKKTELLTSCLLGKVFFLYFISCLGRLSSLPDLLNSGYASLPLRKTRISVVRSNARTTFVSDLCGSLCREQLLQFLLPGRSQALQPLAGRDLRVCPRRQGVEVHR